jgi:hypothetical protein
MEQDNRNLSPLRGPSVWSQPQWDGRSKGNAAERWLVGVTGSALIAIGLQRRARAVAPFVALGAGLLALAASSDGLHRVRAWVEHRRLRSRWDDEVENASDLSFPASDSPSWSPVTSTGIPGDRAPRSE